MITKAGRVVTEFSVDHPKVITWIMALVTVVLVVLAVLPSLWPATFTLLHPVAVDTDPENMLAHDEPVRVFHDDMRREFALHDIVVVGVTNDRHPDGIFNVESLARVHELEQFIRTLRWPDPNQPDRRRGVVEIDLISPSAVDNIEQAGLGTVRFEWLMAQPPSTREEALAVRDRARALPLLDGTLVSEDGRALALYLPLTDKKVSYRVREELLGKVAAWQDTGDEFHITGLPVAEETFGVEMFIQMAIAGPLSMVVIFGVMWWFFRKTVLILSPMIVAMVCVFQTMALLVISGSTIHIMSSMIPVFIMPIAVLDSVHVLSEFFDSYQETRDRRATIVRVMEKLFVPMLYTSITTVAAFASLTLTPIPPVQVFGALIAFGVFLAWLWTITFIPAFVMFIPERRLAGFGHVAGHAGERPTLLGRLLERAGIYASRHARTVLAGTAVVAVIAAVGISRIVINDNPVNWFAASHPIRIADRALNDHFGGTYMAYLNLEPRVAEPSVADYLEGFMARLDAQRAEAESIGIPAAATTFDDIAGLARELAGTVPSRQALLDRLDLEVASRFDAAADDELEAWDEAQLFLDLERQRDEVFKQPEVLQYMSDLQSHLVGEELIGKSNSLADIVKTVHRELLLGEEAEFRIPDSASAVAQTLITFQNSHRPNDLWHFVTPDFRKSSLWLQLPSGDNRDMTRVTDAVDAYVAAHPPPSGLEHQWFGSTYINVVWQQKMVSGMLTSFLGSFIVVLVMMCVLFRSLLWGILAMIPLTVAVGLIYGVIGLIGKDYDMPVAVLSALSLGLAVDYAIHFLARARAIHQEVGAWDETVRQMFGEPARAISRNAIILSLGFSPLLIAPLVPYNTVGILIAAILLTAGIATLVILPALMTVLQTWLFGREPVVKPA